MVWEEKIGWKKCIKFVKGEKKTLVANINNVGAMFVTNECMGIINEAIEENLSFEELLGVIEEKESREYMKVLLESLYCLRVWKYEGEEISSSDFNISLDITNDCNLRCKHCSVSAGEGKRGNDLSENELQQMVEKVVALNPKALTISGGEPLIRKDFKKVVMQIREQYDGPITLMTNATLIDEGMAKFIADNFYSVDVSFDGADEESCAILRGKGVFEKCMNGIKLLKEAGQDRISASMVVTEENQYARADFLKLCEDLNIYPMTRTLDDAGRAEKIYDTIVCSEPERKRTPEEIEAAFKKNELYKTLPQIFACQGANAQFQIDSTGDIYPCGALMQTEFCMGNVLKIENLKEYLEKQLYKKTKGYQNFDTLKPHNLEKCCDCDYNLLCFSCVSDIRRSKEKGVLYKDCIENKVYYGQYWREYESV